MKYIPLNIEIKNYLILILLSGVILLTGCSESTDLRTQTDPTPHINQAQAYLEGHQFKAAFSAATEAIQADSDKLNGYLIIASIHQQLGHAIDSIKILETFTGNKNAEYYFALLDAYQKSQKFISAQKIIDQQQELLSTQTQRLQLAIAQQLLYTNQLTQAKIAFIKLLENSDYKIKSMLALAKIEFSSDNAVSAINIIDEVIELDSMNTEALYLKSLIHMKIGELDNAEKLLTQALTTLPSSDIFTIKRVKVINNLANVLTKQGRIAEAMIYTRILSDELQMEKSVSRQYAQALELFKDKDFSAAKKVLLEILDGNSEHKNSATLLGLILYNEGKPKMAEKYLTNVVDPEISPLKLTELYITTLLQQNKSSDVLELLEYIPEADRNSDTWVLYVRAAIQQKEFEKAKKGLDNAKSLTPKSVRTALLEHFYYNNLPIPQPELASQAIAASLTLNPENSTLQILHIRHLLRLNKKTEVNNYVASLESKYTQNTSTQLIVADYYMHQQKLDKAKRIITDILSSEENNIQALYRIAKINQANKNWALVLYNYNDIIKLYPSEITAYEGVVLSLIALKKDPLESADHLPPNYNPSVLAFTLASLTLQQNKLELATNYAIKAEDELPLKYQARLSKFRLQLDLLKARTALAENDYPKSKKIALSAIERSPNDIRLLTLLTNIEVASGQYNKAKKVVEKIKKLLPNDSLSTLLNAEILIAEGKKKQAIDLLNSYWKKNKNQKVANKLYLELRSFDSVKATTFLDNWRRESPDNMIAARYNAIELQQRGEDKQALAIYHSLLEKVPNEVVSLNNAAWLSFEIGDPQALSLAERAYKLVPNNAAILDTYGWILFHNNDKSRGKLLIEQATKLQPNDKNIKQHLVEINKGS